MAIEVSIQAVSPELGVHFSRTVALQAGGVAAAAAVSAGAAAGAAGAALGVAQLGDDPRYQASLKSSMDLAHAVTLDADLRYVGALPDPSAPAYVELNARVGWKISRRLQLSLSGFNLLHDRHQELPAPALPVPRSVLVGLQWGF